MLINKTAGTVGGSLTSVTTVTNGATGAKELVWTYSVAHANIDYLAAGETATETFTITIADQSGGGTIRSGDGDGDGHQRDPTITTALTDAAGAVTEDAAHSDLSDTGTIAFNDVDLVDASHADVEKTSGTGRHDDPGSGLGVRDDGARHGRLDL